jgi:DNA mismatch repair protein MutS2
VIDQKTLQTLDYEKILDLLAGYTAFGVSTEKAHRLRPVSDLDEARRRQAETSEAVQLLITHADLTIGGARDIREKVDLARHSGVLDPDDLLDVKYTLVAARNLRRTFERLVEQYPQLWAIAERLSPPSGLIDAVSRAISDRGDILDTASDKLASI